MFALEKQLGLGNGTIGKWGKNGRLPNYAKLSAVCDALGVSVEEVMSDDQPIKKRAAQDHKGGSGLPEGYAQLSPVNRAIVDRLIADLAKSQSNS